MEINLNGVTNEQLALICATEVVSNWIKVHEFEDIYSTYSNLKKNKGYICYMMESVAKISLDFLNDPNNPKRNDPKELRAKYEI